METFWFCDKRRAQGSRALSVLEEGGGGAFSVGSCGADIVVGIRVVRRMRSSESGREKGRVLVVEKGGGEDVLMIVARQSIREVNACVRALCRNMLLLLLLHMYAGRGTRCFNESPHVAIVPCSSPVNQYDWVDCACGAHPPSNKSTSLEKLRYNFAESLPCVYPPAYHVLSR